MTDKRDLQKLLDEMGFKPVRNGKHALYSNGKINIALPHGSKLNPGLIKWFKILVRKGQKNQRKDQFCEL